MFSRGVPTYLASFEKEIGEGIDKDLMEVVEDTNKGDEKDISFLCNPYDN